MNLLAPYEEIIYSVSDITAGIFLIILIISIALQPVRRPGLGHLLASAILTLGGVILRIFAGTIAMLPDGFTWKSGMYLLPYVSADVILGLSFVYIAIGISESANCVIYINEHDKKSGFWRRLLVCAVIAAAGIILYACTGNMNVLSIATLAEFCYFWLYIHRNCSVNAVRDFTRASVFAATTFAMILFFQHIRLTGLGLTVMLLVLIEQYHNHVGLEFAENEAALAKNKVQLLVEQISPHYIYNSLQSISGLCTTDPEGAREAIEAFSEYLRGNLESLTSEELIPFIRELELTQAYLELERLSGLRSFKAEYDLAVTDFMLPPLVLQPVVENAVKHGAMVAAQSATLIIIATMERDEIICIEVNDSPVGDSVMANDVPAKDYAADSAGISLKQSKKKSVGLENVRTRLAIQCGGTLDISSSGNGTKVTIKLPKVALSMP